MRPKPSEDYACLPIVVYKETRIISSSGSSESVVTSFLRLNTRYILIPTQSVLKANYFINPKYRITRCNAFAPHGEKDCCLSRTFC